MGSTITEKILARRAGRDRVAAGDNVWVDIDTLMIHDVFGPDVFAVMESELGEKARIFDRDRVVVIPDHYIFTADTRALSRHAKLDAFVARYGITHYFGANSPAYSGVSHITLAQAGFTRPGEILLGTDSHSCTAGAFGMFATGIGVTDAAYALATGRLWLKLPETIRVEVDGQLPPGVMAKDLILNVIGDLGVAGAAYRAIEFGGTAVAALSMEERMTICNMAIEAGGKNGVIAADDVTAAYLDGRCDGPVERILPDPDAVYHRVLRYRAEDLSPIVACPHSPDRRATVASLGAVNIDRVYVGSCTGGKITDFRAAARVIRNRKVVVDTVIVPATMAIRDQLRSERMFGRSLEEIFTDAGCRIGPPSCGACFGGPLDTVGRSMTDETVVSTTNRNFPGRMGSRASQVYLASPYTAAASALTGRIADPRHFLED